MKKGANMRIFLGSFLNDWWDSISKFFTGLNSTVSILIICALALLCLLCLVRFIKPMYSADKNKIRIMPLIFCILFGGLTAFVACATYV